MPLSTDAVRRLAYAAFAVCLFSFLLGCAELVSEIVSGTHPGTEGSWGSSGPVGDLLLGVTIFAFPLVGVLLAHRQPRNTISWLLLAVALFWALGLVADGYAVYAVDTNPGSLPRPDIAAALGVWVWVPAIGLLGTFLILLFPDGHLPSPRWRVVAWISGLTITLVSFPVLLAPGPIEDSSAPNLDNPLVIPAIQPVLNVLEWLLLIYPACIVACAVALVLRFRRSSGVERLQMKWLATGGGLVAALYVVTLSATFLADAGTFSETAPWITFLQDVSTMSFGVIPVAIGVAILRHRLYGIDVVINKALVFGTLAAFITAVYVGIVVGIGALAGRGDRPNLALSILATAIVAVAFAPVRERVQRFANRLVYGARATPYEVLSDFATRMGGTYASAELLPQMARTVAEGVGAASVEVWLKLGTTLVREATWPPTTDPAPTPLDITDDQPPALPADRIVPVRHHHELLGVISIHKPPNDPITPAEDKLLNDVASQTGLVLRNARLIEELRTSRQRLVTTQDTERRRLERDLHDGAQQSLVSVALILRMAKNRLTSQTTDGAGADITAALDQASSQLATAIDELRELARGIHPAILTERGLGPAITALAERCPIPVTTTYTLDTRPPPTIEGTAYFVVAEALTNTAKYAHATTITITAHHHDKQLTLTITDDGIGGANPNSGSGLTGLTDRIAAVDGTLTITSPPGHGTTLTAHIPLPTTPPPTPATEASALPPTLVGGPR
jgi:signal transduction histidine kinase